MENLEQYWEQSFSPIGRKFTEIRPNYQDMGKQTVWSPHYIGWNLKCIMVDFFNSSAIGAMMLICLQSKDWEQLTQHIQNNFLYRHTASSKDWKMTANYKSYGIFPSI